MRAIPACLLSAALSAAAPGAAPPPRPSILELAELLARPDAAPAERYFAVYALLDRDEPEALDLLLAAARGARPADRRLPILEGIRLRPNPRAAKCLIDLLTDPDPSVTAAAVAALEEHQDAVSLARLAEALGDRGRPPAARRAAAEILGRAGDFSSLGALVAALSDKDDGVRTASRAALESISEESLPGDPGQAWAAWLERNRFATREVWLASHLRTLRKRLSELESETRSLREERNRLARERLLAAAAEGRWPAVAEALRQDRAAEVRAAAARALAEGDPPGEMLPPLREAFSEDPDPEVRAEAIRALAARGDAAALPLVAAHLDAPPSGNGSGERLTAAVIDAAARLLAREAPARRPAGIMDRVRAGLGAEAPRVVIAATKALADLRDDAAPAQIARLLSHADKEVRVYAAQALAGAGRPGDADAVAARLREEPDGRVRENLLLALGQLGGKAHLEPALALLEDADDRVREEAWKAAKAIAARAGLSAADAAPIGKRLERSGRTALALDWYFQALKGVAPQPGIPSSEAAVRMHEAALALALALEDWPRALILAKALREAPGRDPARLRAALDAAGSAAGRSPIPAELREEIARLRAGPDGREPVTP